MSDESTIESVESEEEDAPFRWVYAITFDRKWIGDGLDLTPEKLEMALMKFYSHLRSDEIGISLIEEPDPKRIRREQGYKD